MKASVLVTIEVGPEWEDRLQREFPDVRFTFSQEPAQVAAAARDADVMLANALTREAVAHATGLRWLQAGTAGVSHLLYSEFRDRGVILTNARAQGAPMAELVLAMMFAFAVRMPQLVEGRARREQVGQRVVREKFELQGQTLLICGLGDVGGTLCRKAAGIGMRVIGLRRRPELDCEGASLVVGVDRLREQLPRADHIAVTLPLTQGTRGFIGEREFALIRPDAHLYNVGGGATVDGRALTEALRGARLAGAGLDVTDPDPLPPDDPLWTLDNVILTQHTSGASPKNQDRVAAIFAQNLRRYLSGQPLWHMVDQLQGY